MIWFGFVLFVKFLFNLFVVKKFQQSHEKPLIVVFRKVEKVKLIEQNRSIRDHSPLNTNQVNFLLLTVQ